MALLRGVFARRLAPMGLSALLALWPGVSGPATQAVTLQPLVSDYVWGRQFGENTINP